MKKPKFLAMTLAAALFAGMLFEAPLMTVRAEGTTETPSVSGNTGASTEGTSGEAGQTLTAPTVEWTTVGQSRWNAKITIPEWDTLKEKEGKLCWKIFRVIDSVPYEWADGECDFISYLASNTYTCDLSSYIWESNTYKLGAWTEIVVDGNIVKSAVNYSAEQVYTAPEQRLGTVQDVVWDTEQMGVYYFTPLESNNVWRYSVALFKESTDDGWTWVDGVILDSPESGRMKGDFSSAIQRNGEGVYCVTVQAHSNDVDTIADGYESGYSVALDTRTKTEDASEKIENAIAANDGDPGAAVEAVKGAVSLDELATQMQISADVLEQISDLESEYASTNNIEVEQSVTEEAAALGISAAGISVVGAGFNADPNSTVTLTIDVPEEKVPVPGGYKSGTQLDITLEGGNSQDGQLNMPVTVTMPVPAGINLNRLVLWHYHGDTRSQIDFKNNGDGTITFTVTSFSTFLFTEAETTETPSGSTTQSGSSNTSTTTTSASTQTKLSEATEEKTEPVALTYVVKRGDNMYRIARKHGLTLAQLAAWNPQIKNPAKIYAGQVLIVGYKDAEPEAADTENAEYYVVRKGDSLFRIAAKHNLTLAELKLLNPKLFQQRYIFAGQKVRVK